MADATTSTLAPNYPSFGSGNKLLPAPNPLEGAGQAINVAQGMQNLSQSQFDLAHKQLGAVNSLMATIAQNPTDDVIAQSAVTARGLGIPADTIAQEISTLSTMNPQQRVQYAIGHISRNAEAAQQIQLATGTPTQSDIGGQKVWQRVNPLTNTVTPMGGSGAVMQNTLPPQTRVQRQDIVDRTGQVGNFPVGELYDAQGNFRGAPGQGGNPAVSQVPAPTAGPAGSAAGPAQQPAGQSGAAPQIPGAAAPRGMVTGLSPSVTSDRAASTQSFTDARNDVAPSRDRVFGLVQAIGALRNTNTGVGTQYRQNVLNAINALPGGLGKTIVPDSANLSDYDIAKKYLSNFQLTRPGATRSDAGLANAQAGSPNVEHMTNPAAVETALNFLGQERMRQAQTISYINSKRDPGDFANYGATEFGKASDPKAYALGAMTPQERSAYALSLKGPAKTKFLNSVRLGLATGVLSRDDLQGASGGQ